MSRPGKTASKHITPTLRVSFAEGDSSEEEDRESSQTELQRLRAENGRVSFRDTSERARSCAHVKGAPAFTNNAFQGRFLSQEERIWDGGDDGIEHARYLDLRGLFKWIPDIGACGHLLRPLNLSTHGRSRTLVDVLQEMRRSENHRMNIERQREEADAANGGWEYWGRLYTPTAPHNAAAFANREETRRNKLSRKQNTKSRNTNSGQAAMTEEGR
ncbi:hypothetical protein MKEN_00849800 [Mycena kentingensis (nom. inval.)]|nr:hypothetical protein MKEN_00849800 [Mycena kentingensis (nom. inval.)]